MAVGGPGTAFSAPLGLLTPRRPLPAFSCLSHSRNTSYNTKTDETLGIGSDEESAFLQKASSSLSSPAGTGISEEKKR